MTMPASRCSWRMQVHHIHQETPDVWILSLLRHDYYPYRAGQYTLVSVYHPAETLHAYTLFSTPGVNEYITLTIRCIDEGAGSQWLTREVKHGDYLWLSGAMDEFACDNKVEDKFLLLATDCGVTPITSMHRWPAKCRPQADAQMIYCVRSPEDVIFAEEWRQYPVTLVTKHHAIHGFVAGRLTREPLQSVSDLASHTVMTCDPAPYMEKIEQDVAVLGVIHFFKEKFLTSVAEAAASGLKFTKLQPACESYAPMGTTLFDALKGNKVPVAVACRAGVCGCRKTKVAPGKYSITGTMTLTGAEVADGYVLACPCHPQSDLVLT